MSCLTLKEKLTGSCASKAMSQAMREPGLSGAQAKRRTETLRDPALAGVQAKRKTEPLRGSGKYFEPMILEPGDERDYLAGTAYTAPCVDCSAPMTEDAYKKECTGDSNISYALMRFADCGAPGGLRHISLGDGNRQIEQVSDRDGAQFNLTNATRQGSLTMPGASAAHKHATVDPSGVYGSASTRNPTSGTPLSQNLW